MYIYKKKGGGGNLFMVPQLIPIYSFQLCDLEIHALHEKIVHRIWKDYIKNG